jgi:hypothetical protein
VEVRGSRENFPSGYLGYLSSTGGTGAMKALLLETPAAVAKRLAEFFHPPSDLLI